MPRMTDPISSALTAFARRRPWTTGACVVLFFFCIGYATFLAPPVKFPAGSIISISTGESGADVADFLAHEEVIQNPLLLRVLLHFSGRTVQAGAYRFAHPENVVIIGYRLATGDFGIPPARVTFPEGSTVRDMSLRIADTLPGVSAKSFTTIALPYQGYLFPDTYTFAPSTTASDIVATLRENFSAHLTPLLPQIAKSGHSIADIVTMASILEKEAQTLADKQIVAGILWNRLKAGMRLQVDAAPDTYLHTGLPATPLCNPGLDALEAATSPAPTSYVYYLTGKDGKMHYAVTFAQHKLNEERYLY